MKLIFVYNARSGFINTAIDSIHKIISPQTYNCNLCKLTHGWVGERREWEEFKASLNLEFEFYYKDQFVERFAKKFSFPAVILKNDGKFNVVISSKKLDKIKDFDQLKNEIKNITSERK